MSKWRGDLKAHAVLGVGIALLVGSLSTLAVGAVDDLEHAAPRASPPSGRAGLTSGRQDDEATSVSLRLDPAGRGRTPSGAHQGAPTTRVLDTGAFTMAAATWRGGPAGLRVRVRASGAWGAWQPLTALSDLPDAAAGPDATVPGRHATDLRWVGPADGAQVRVVSGHPTDLRLTLVDTPAAVPDASAARTQDRPRAGHHGARHRLRPHLRSRHAWHADPRLRSGTPRINRTIQQVHVHHTAGSNGYSRAEVPGILQGIYRYHTQTLGWSDIGYNFLVDRFGRTWVGRAGGAGRAVQGAHTLGFNSTSTGVAVIGDYSRARPSRAVLHAIARLAAWKLHRYHRHPLGHAWVYSHGSDRWAAGREVRLPVIDGHRDTNQTECPGAHLYADLPRIRRMAAHVLRHWRRVHRHHHRRHHHHHRHHH